MSDIATGIAFLFVGVGILYLLYQLGRFYKNMADLEERYQLCEIAIINKKARDKGIDLDKEKQKLRTMAQFAKKRSFRKELEWQIINEWFGEMEAENGNDN